MLVFLLLRLTPGDPAAIMAGDAATAEQIERIRAGLGLDRPLVVQFGLWIQKILSGDLGESFYYRIKVTTLIAQRLEPTFALATLTILIAVLVSIPLGVLAAWRYGGWFDRALMGFSVLGFSVPVFVLAYLLIWLVSLQLGWLPVQGYARLADGLWPFLRHLILPSITLSVIYIALIARVTRASVLEALGEDYIRTARAKGAPVWRHQCRRADRHRDRHRHRHPDRRRGGDRVGVCHPGPWPAHGRRGAGARLSDDPGRDPLLLVHLRGDQPADRSLLCVSGPEDPVLKILHNWSVRIGGTALVALVLIALAAPWLGTVDPTLFDAASRDLRPGEVGEITTLEGATLKHVFLMGSDSFGRDIYSRVLYGTRVSLIVGLAAALLALLFGVVCGLSAGYIRWLDGLVMRVMDGIMAIPAILIAIAVVALWRASLPSVVIAIAIPEIPRVTRLVRALVLSIREEPYVEAAVSLGTPTAKIMFGHILPNTIAPLLVQGTYICAFAILLEAILSFLGVGLPPDIPTWGNIMAEGRVQFVAYPHNVFLPGVFLAITVLAVNILGDGLRDTLDPKMAKRV